MPKGFTCASRIRIKEGDAEDLALFYSDKAAEAAAVFTRNLAPGAPKIAGRKPLKGQTQVVVVNSVYLMLVQVMKVLKMLTACLPQLLKNYLVQKTKFRLQLV